MNNSRNTTDHKFNFTICLLMQLWVVNIFCLVWPITLHCPLINAQINKLFSRWTNDNFPFSFDRIFLKFDTKSMVAVICHVFFLVSLSNVTSLFSIIIIIIIIILVWKINTLCLWKIQSNGMKWLRGQYGLHSTIFIN